MPTFNSLSGLSNYMNSSAGQASIISSDAVQVILKRQAERLKQCIIKRVNDYYSSYNPFVYDRTYGLQSSLEVDNDIEVSISGMTINVGFSGSDAYQPSLFGGGDAYTPSLMNYGWQVKKDVWFKNIEHFGYYEGAHFLENGIADWQAGNTEGITVKAIYNKY